jgi:hypothetical protein
MTKVTGESGRKIEVDLNLPLILVAVATALLVTSIVLDGIWAVALFGVMMIAIAFALASFRVALAPLPDDYTRSGKSIKWMTPVARICCGVGFVILGLCVLGWLIS